MVKLSPRCGRLLLLGSVILLSPMVGLFILVLFLQAKRIVSKTYRTRIEGENTRLRHYLARLHRKTLCYSQSLDMLAHSIRLLIHYLKFGDVPVPYRV